LRPHPRALPLSSFTHRFARWNPRDIGFQLLALNDPRLVNPMLSAGLLNPDR